MKQHTNCQKQKWDKMHTSVKLSQLQGKGYKNDQWNLDNYAQAHRKSQSKKYIKVSKDQAPRL